MYLPIDEILATPPKHPQAGDAIGRSREGRSVRAHCLGRGPLRVSLIAGCHADEPVGPWMLRRLAAYLERAGDGHPLRSAATWWIVPHTNPDGEVRNRAWCEPEVREGPAGAGFDPARYLRHAVREQPGDDVEFGFPPATDPDDPGARPENRAVAGFLAEAARDGPFHLHASLHSMAYAAGPWFLIDDAWRDRAAPLMQTLADRAADLGYTLHDVERGGEKGFHRIARGFCTRPDSESMKRYFLERNDPETAARFRPSSMEFVRDLGGDPLTLVSEVPIFAVRGLGETIRPTDPVADRFRSHVLPALRAATSPAAFAARLDEAGVKPVPIAEQMRFQLLFLEAGLRLTG